MARQVTNLSKAEPVADRRKRPTCEALRSAQDDKHRARQLVGERIGALVLLLVLDAFGALAQAISPNELSRISYDQHIGQAISRDLRFQDSDKRTVALGDLLDTKPTLFVLGYYHCPMLCTVVNDGLIESLQELRFDVGKDFNIINLSIGRIAGPNPWRATGLEWQTDSPPPKHNFNETPIVTAPPRQYSTEEDDDLRLANV